MDNNDVARAAEWIRKLRAACHVKSVDVGRLPSGPDLQLKARLSEAHHWDGASALDGQILVLAFRLHSEAAFLAKWSIS